MWDPAQYDRYADERSRPFHELLARVPAGEPEQVVDLGCGNGVLTRTLAQRWPAAAVLGVDTSAAMLAEAAKVVVPGRLSFRSGNIADWRPERPVDVIVSNAALHWVPDHAALLDRLVRGLAPKGWLAFQVPGNFQAPSHTIMAELCRSEPWRDRLGDVPRDEPVRDPAEYFDLLVAAGCSVDAWETTYLHVLSGPNPVLEWVRGTALRPVLSALAADSADPAGAERFEREYGARLLAAYPPGPAGTVLPFRRIFVVARRLG